MLTMGASYAACGLLTKTNGGKDDKYRKHANPIISLSDTSGLIHNINKLRTELVTSETTPECSIA